MTCQGWGGLLLFFNLRSDWANSLNVYSGGSFVILCLISKWMGRFFMPDSYFIPNLELCACGKWNGYVGEQRVTCHCAHFLPLALENRDAPLLSRLGWWMGNELRYGKPHLEGGRLGKRGRERFLMESRDWRCIFVMIVFLPVGREFQYICKSVRIFVLFGG